MADHTGKSSSCLVFLSPLDLRERAADTWLSKWAMMREEGEARGQTTEGWKSPQRKCSCSCLAQTGISRIISRLRATITRLCVCKSHLRGEGRELGGAAAQASGSQSGCSSLSSAERLVLAREVAAAPFQGIGCATLP